MAMVKRALLSCYEKRGLTAFAKQLAALGIELVASGGTATTLREAGVRVTTVEAFAGMSEQLDGRVKTLHPTIYAGILARRDDPAHVAAVGAEKLIDLVVVNLYPFEETVAQPEVSWAQAVERIDVGGVTLLRAAAKNFAHVGVVCDPQQYDTVAKALQEGRGMLGEEVSRALAIRAFERTSRYDAAISQFFSGGRHEMFPPIVSTLVQRRQQLRYGENPHQPAAWYVPTADAAEGVVTFEQLQGKELSYNNLLDIDTVVRCLADFEQTTCVVVKHAAPCGVARAASPLQAYERAYAADAESAFGGVVGVNRPIDAALATQLNETFLEVVVAPEVESAARRLLAEKPNRRVVTLPWPPAVTGRREWRWMLGGWMVQEIDSVVFDPQALRVVTTRIPTDEERTQLLFAWTVVKHLKSNAIVLVAQETTRGMGQGQPSRVGAVRLALQATGARASGTVAASDGFFPFADGVELLAKAGIKAIIQPGGSVRDAEVIEAANRAGIAMVFTGMRHFRH